MIDNFKGEYRFLSNYHLCPILWQGIQFGSVEHAYQAAKSLNPIDWEVIAAFLKPKEAKAYGYEIKLREDWATYRLEIMEELLRQKFNHTELKSKLLATSPQELVEGNTWGDAFWGVCNGGGENHLGKLLVKIRDQFKHE